MSQKALLTVPDTLYTAINTSYGDDGDKDGHEDYADLGKMLGKQEGPRQTWPRASQISQPGVKGT